jgi:hypothetical protein
MALASARPSRSKCFKQPVVCYGCRFDRQPVFVQTVQPFFLRFRPPFQSKVVRFDQLSNVLLSSCALFLLQFDRRDVLSPRDRPGKCRFAFSSPPHNRPQQTPPSSTDLWPFSWPPQQNVRTSFGSSPEPFSIGTFATGERFPAAEVLREGSDAPKFGPPGGAAKFWGSSDGVRGKFPKPSSGAAPVGGGDAQGKRKEEASFLQRNLSEESKRCMF